MRTNFGFKPATKTQQEVARRFFHLNKSTKSTRQQIRLSEFNPLTGRLILDNFYVKVIDGIKVWVGYKIIIFRDGELAYDREFEVKTTETGMVLIRPSSIKKAA